MVNKFLCLNKPYHITKCQSPQLSRSPVQLPSLTMFTEEQLEAISRAHETLRQVGLGPTDLVGGILPFEQDFLGCILDYISPKATLYTPEEVAEKKNQLTRQSKIAGIVDHPMGAIVEFPESGDQMDMAIAHRFQIDPEHFINPQHNIQYSLGNPSLHSNVTCLLLHDQTTGAPVKCQQTKLFCNF